MGCDYFSVVLDYFTSGLFSVLSPSKATRTTMSLRQAFRSKIKDVLHGSDRHGYHNISNDDNGSKDETEATATKPIQVTNNIRYLMKFWTRRFASKYILVCTGSLRHAHGLEAKVLHAKLKGCEFQSQTKCSWFSPQNLANLINSVSF